jgi:RNA polymerase sigma-70 factor, ECF subfamily
MTGPRNDWDSEDQLVGRCVRGSEAAWHEFYRRYDGLIRIVVRRRNMLSTSDDREDLVQSVYLKLVTSLGNYRKDKGSLKAFVSLIAERTCIQHFRRRTTAARYAGTNPVDHHDSGEEGTIGLESTLDSPHELLQSSEQVGRMRSALGKLKAECRRLLDLRFFKELSYGNIAQRLGRKENTVNVQILRCLAELKANYDRVDREGLEA